MATASIDRVRRVRGSTSKIVKLLSGKDISVTQIGSQAFVEHHRQTLECVRVNIPVIPEECSDQFLDAIEGFIDHEVGHVLFTEGEPTRIAIDESARLNVMRNIIEDTFVERKMRESFTGCDRNINNLSHLFLERFIEPEVRKLAGETNENLWMNAVGVPLIRAMSGQQIFHEWLEEKGIYDKMPRTVGRLEPFRSRIANVSSSWEVLELSREILKALDEAKVETPEETPNQEKTTDDREEQQQQQRQADPDVPQQPKPEQNEGDQGQSGRSEPDDPSEDGDPQSGETESDEQTDEEESGTDEEGDAGLDQDDGVDDEGGEDGGTSDSRLDDGSDGGSSESEEQGNEEASESESQPDEEDAGASWDGDSDDSSNPLAAGNEGEEKTCYESDGQEEGSSDDELDQEQEGGSGSGGVGGADPRGETLDLDCEEFDEAVAYVLSQMGNEETTSSSYTPYTTSYDKVDYLDTSDIPTDTLEYLLSQVDEATQTMVGPMLKQLERAFRANNKARWENGKRSGALNTTGLHRLATNDDRVFRTKQMTKTKRVAVTLLVDMSGSMHANRKMTMATEAAWALASVLSRLDINFEVLGFTTKDYTEWSDEEREAYSQGRGQFKYQRADFIKINICKGFGDKFAIDSKRRIAAMPRSKMHFNVDGESVRMAADRLLTQKEPGKTLIVLSDGMPCGYASDDHALRMHLKKVVGDVEKQGINVVGMGIATDAVKRFYPKYVVLNNPIDLPKTVVAKLRDAILQKDKVT